MLSSVEQAFVGRDEIRAPLKMLAWEARSTPASLPPVTVKWAINYQRRLFRRSFNHRAGIGKF